MNGIGGIGAQSRYERYQQQLQAFNEPIRKASDAPSSNGAAEGIGFGASAQPAAAPSLLVALQEANLVRAENGGEEDEAPVGLFARREDDEQSRLIDEILEKGIANWAHEKWIEKIREKARQTALAGMGMTEEDVAALSPEMQEQIERLIEEIVEEAVREATEGTAKKHAETESNGAMVLNPIMTGG